MSIPVVGFFNNKGGVGKTSLVYHLACMYEDLGRNVLAADLDPQANLTAAFVKEERLEELWPELGHERTVYGAIEPVVRGLGDIRDPALETVGEGVHLIVGDLALAGFEDELSQQWHKCLDRSTGERAFRVVSAFWRLVQKGAERAGAEVVLADLGPNLGSINRSAIVACDYVVIPLAPDIFSLQGLKNLGPTLRRWRQEWKQRLEAASDFNLDLPSGRIEPVGYIVLQHAVRLDRPVKAYERWMARIPQVYASEVAQEELPPDTPASRDPHCLGLLEHYPSLMPMAQEARKPMFRLRPADGAMGAHVHMVEAVRQDFENLAREIAARSWERHPANKGP